MNQSVIYCLNTNKSCRKESVYYCVQVEVLLVDNWLLRNYRSSSPAATFVRRAFSWRACVGLGLPQLLDENKLGPLPVP